MDEGTNKIRLRSAHNNFCLGLVLWAPVQTLFCECICLWLNSFHRTVKYFVAVDGGKSVVSGVPQGSVLLPLLIILYTADVFMILENQMVINADDSPWSE